MASVFLSYDREDAGRARTIAAALEKAGHSVWWDLHVRGGAQFSKVIEEALKAADAVVVLWSERSVESAWVRDEAAAGRDSGRLVPVSLDVTEPPLGFRQFQTIDLTRWRGRGRIPGLQELLLAVDQVAGSAAEKAPAAPPAVAATRGGKLRVPLVLGGVALLFVAVAGLWLWKPWEPGHDVPIVAVAAAEASPLSQSLARDLLTKLGTLQVASSNPVRLTEHGEGAGRRADLIFEVGGARTPDQAVSNLVLLSGRDRTVLWSREFKQPDSRIPDLKQQLAFTAARVLGCARDALPANGRRLKQQTLKVYLSGCALLAETEGVDTQPTIPMFQEVIAKAPDFEGAWAKLLSARNEIYSGTGSADAREKLVAEVAAARKVNPNMPAVYQAEISLLPENAYAKRMNLAERAVAQNPHHATSLAGRSVIFSFLGRMDAAVNDARAAVELDPLSPTQRIAYINALAHAGQIQAAFKQLEEAERLWPGASNIAHARWGLNLRYGDPREALRWIESGGADIAWRGARPYLAARIDPTPAKITAAVEDARRWYERVPGTLFHLAQVYGEFDREEELLQILLNAPLADATHTMQVMFRPKLVDFWHDPRALRLAKRVGMLTYWRQSGQWPDFCSDPDLPYDCKEEAAKLAA